MTQDPPHPVPTHIRKGETGLEIQWNDEHQSFYGYRDLRLMCQCAECVEEMSGRPLLDPARVPDQVRIDQLQLVGAYAIRPNWSDGHSTGIYTYRYLLAHCTCERCSGQSTAGA